MAGAAFAAIVSGSTLLATQAGAASPTQTTPKASPRQPSAVSTAKAPDGSYKYIVNGREQVLIGMGYDPIYRNLPDAQRQANYRRDFALLRNAGVNTITGWDADKGYEQDKFDELTLDTANEFGLGVVMPLNLSPEGDYRDPVFVGALKQQARDKLQRFKDYPALRMWGVGNEVYWVMNPDMWPAFSKAYLEIIDLFHEMDPNHPVIYREAEDTYVPELAQALRDSGDMRPWLLYGMNIYDKDPRSILSHWPDLGLDRPMMVSEFGAEGSGTASRAAGYVDMWRAVREFPQYVFGGAPYVWTTAGPEPTDKIWGLMDINSRPVDGTFALLSREWQREPSANRPPR